MLPAVASCPICNTEKKLSKLERKYGLFICLECGEEVSAKNAVKVHRLKKMSDYGESAGDEQFSAVKKRTEKPEKPLGMVALAFSFILDLLAGILLFLPFWLLTLYAMTLAFGQRGYSHLAQLFYVSIFAWVIVFPVTFIYSYIEKKKRGRTPGRWFIAKFLNIGR